MKYHFALCDDEEEQLLILQEIIMTFLSEKNIDVEIDCYTSGNDLLNIQKDKRYDIIFLDMQMPEINGIEIGKRIREVNKNVIIIYITGFVDFAINAFEIRAFDYIVKPVSIKNLKKTILDAIIKVDESRHSECKRNEFLLLTYNKKIVNIKVHDIIFLEKIKNKVFIFCDDYRHEVYDSLVNIRKKLDEDIFMQPHQGYIINKKKMLYYQNQQITLAKEYTIPVSKKNINMVKKVFFESLRY